MCVDNQAAHVVTWTWACEQLFRESMSEYFGTTGRLWLGAQVVTPQEDGSRMLNVKHLDIIFHRSPNSECWQTTVLGIHVVLDFLKQRMPHIHTVALQSDRHDSLHSPSLWGNYIHLNQREGGPRIVSHRYTESGCGKTSLDAHFGLAKQVRRPSVFALLELDCASLFSEARRK